MRYPGTIARIVVTNTPTRRARSDEGRDTQRRRWGRWRRLSREILSAHPTCADPFGRHGLPEPAVEVHHIVPIREHPGRMLDPSNLIQLCRACHEVAERAGPTDAVRARSITEQVGGDPDGGGAGSISAG